MSRIGRSLVVALLVAAPVAADKDPRHAPRWIKQLLSENRREYRSAIHTLGLMREKAAPAYLAGLKDRDPDIRYQCAQLLMTCGAKIERDMVPALARALRDTTRDVRTYAAIMLAEAGDCAVSPLLTVLATEDDEGPRYEAARAIALLGPPGVEALAERLGRAPAKSRAGVLRDVALVARIQRREIKAMRETFLDEGLMTDPWRAFRLCRNMRYREDSHFEQRAAPIYLDSAIKKLETLVLRAEAAAPRTAELLVEALKDEEPEARAVALRAVGLFGEDAGPYRPALRAALGDADEEVRAAAADALWRAGAADDLIDALKGDDEAAATAAAGGLRKFVSAERIAPLLDDANPVVRRRAVQLAGALGTHGMPLRKKLNELARDGEKTAHDALAEIARGGALAQNMKAVEAGAKRGSREERIAFLKEAAYNGNLVAMVELARLFGKTGDPDDAMDWYHQAASQGGVALKEELGDVYWEGSLGERDLELALHWWRQATAEGSETARVKVADALWAMRWIPGDRDWQLEEAERWYRPAAQKGIAWAQYRLGMLCKERDGRGDDVAGAEWLRKAALQGETRAYYPLAKCYLLFGGLSKDYIEFCAWRRLAADAGDEKAKEDERDARSRKRDRETEAKVRRRVKELRKLIEEG